MKVSKADRAQAIEQMRKWLEPGDTVYTILEHVSRSGMSRDIRVVLMKTDDDGKPYMLHPNHSVSLILGEPRGKWEGIKVGGCGMDMGFHIVYALSCALFPEGFGELGTGPHGHKIRPKTKEKAAECVAKGVKFYGRNGDKSGWDNDGGYALNHKWL